jgi:hypothetical protein
MVEINFNEIREMRKAELVMSMLETEMHFGGNSADRIIKGSVWWLIYNLDIIINWSWTFGTSPRLNPLNVFLIKDKKNSVLNAVSDIVLFCIGKK